MNSIHDSQAGLDERYFFYLKREADGRIARDVDIAPGDTFRGIIYVWNNTNPASALSTQNATLSAQIPRGLTGSVSASARACADNAQPNCVWSSVTFHSGRDKSLELLIDEKSIQWHTQELKNPISVSREDVENGMSIGCEALNGIMDGTEGCRGFLTFQILVREPLFEVRTFLDSPNRSGRVLPGNKVDVRVEVKNLDTVSRRMEFVGARLSPGVELDANRVSTAKWDAEKSAWVDQTSIASEDVGADANQFWIRPLEDVEPGGVRLMEASVTISSDNQNECGGNWLKVGGFVYFDDVPLVDDEIISTVPVC